MPEDRFKIVSEKRLKGHHWIIILKDTVTGVFYLHSQLGTGGGVTPLLGSDGKPIINLKDREI